MSYDRNKAIAIAEAEVGYLEKATLDQLDDKTANAGSKNYTKYARDLAAVSFFNGSKQGIAWCATFVGWCFYKAFGKAAALKLLCQPARNNCGAGCKYARNYFSAKGQLFDSPEPGDMVFFWPSDRSDPNKVQHTGLVCKVDSTYVYTIEGNTSGASGVIANGGGVCKKKYKLNYARLAGFGRPDWGMDGGDAESSAPDATVPDTTVPDTTVPDSTTTTGKTSALGSRMLENGSSGEDVKELQEALNRLPCITTKLTVDGKYGAVTASAVKTFQKAYSIQVDGKYGPKSHKAMTAALATLDTPEEAPADSEQTPTEEVEAAAKGATVTIVASAPDRKVNIRVGNGTDYGRITQVADGTTYPWVATAENGWHAIVIGKRVGWVSGTYSRKD